MSDTVAAATVIKCMNNAGEEVYTDNSKNCAASGDAETLHNLSAGDVFYNEIPDLLQTLDTADFAGGGQQFCAPVAVSNTLVWLEGNADEQYQLALAKKLSSSAYMGTSLEDGTSASDLTTGLHKYAMERWGRYKTLEYSGWSKVPKKFASARVKPTLDWMQQALHRKGGVFLNIGWYNPQGIDYARNGGHWVTLVGYDNGKLIVHDPAPRSGKEFSNEYVSVAMLDGGRLIRNNSSTEARNHFIISDGLAISKKGKVAIIDGAVRFELY